MRSLLYRSGEINKSYTNSFATFSSSLDPVSEDLRALHWLLISMIEVGNGHPCTHAAKLARARSVEPQTSTTSSPSNDLFEVANPVESITHSRHNTPSKERAPTPSPTAHIQSNLTHTPSPNNDITPHYLTHLAARGHDLTNLHLHPEDLPTLEYALRFVKTAMKGVRSIRYMCEKYHVRCQEVGITYREAWGWVKQQEQELERESEDEDMMEVGRFRGGKRIFGRDHGG